MPPVYTPRRAGLALLLLLILFVSNRQTTPNHQAVLPDDDGHSQQSFKQSVPPIDRHSLLDKFRRIEVLAGYARYDQDIAEQRAADRVPARASKQREEFVQSHLLDYEVCPYTQSTSGFGSCKFLFPAWIGEQETKAQLHLYQLGLLAIALNRALVLPNMVKGRMMSCAKKPFDYYYEPDSLTRLLGNASTISFERFSEWSNKRLDEPTARIVSIAKETENYPSGATIQHGQGGVDNAAMDLGLDTQALHLRIPNLPDRKLCLDPPRVSLDFVKYAPLAMYPPLDWHRSDDSSIEFGSSLVETLAAPDIKQRPRSRPQRMAQGKRAGQNQLAFPADVDDSSPDVLVISYELRYPIFSEDSFNALMEQRQPSFDTPAVQSFSYLEYASAWTDIGMRIVKALEPFIAIHWRQETMPLQSIMPCAESLIAKLLEVTDDPSNADIKTIYLLTDYPVEALTSQQGDDEAEGADLQSSTGSSSAHSGTFTKLLAPQHHDGMRTFLRVFREKITKERGIRLTMFAEERQRLLHAEQRHRDEQEAAALLASEAVVAAHWGGPHRPGQRISSPRKYTLSPLVYDEEMVENLARLDAGLIGIIDKTIATHAQYFIAGTPLKGVNTAEVACAKASSFTNQIIDARSAAVKDNAEGDDEGADVDPVAISGKSEGGLYRLR
ncbi:hypothetical protein EMMF5_003232, partial [Cystobasidiomycetes sp. EMM_F5]